MSKFTVNAQHVRSAQSCQGTKDVRYYLNGILFAANGDIIGTDGHILACAKPDNKAEAVYFVDDNDVPVDTIVSIDGKIPATANELTFCIETKTVRTDKGKIFAFTIVDGTFPAYERVLPTLPRDNHASGFTVNMTLLGRISNGLPKGAKVDFYPADQHSCILAQYACDGIIEYAIMPMRSEADFYALKA